MTGGDQSISWLMFFTFGATIFIIAGACIQFLKRLTNRAVASDALVGHDGTYTAPAPDGALPELLAVALFAVIAMGLLAGGYAAKSQYEKAPSMPQVGGQMPANR